MRRRKTVSEASPLRRELAQQEALVRGLREDMYSIEPRYRRSLAAAALAASIAEQTYAVMDGLPQWQNETALQWRGHLGRVWLYLAGDEQQHYALSAAVADYLRSPLNHVEGQDGPDDADRPQTVAAMAAALTLIHWAVDFVETALAGLFEAVDLKHGQELGKAREEEVTDLVGTISSHSKALREALQREREVPTDLLEALRG
jgi:hypothetical protein